MIKVKRLAIFLLIVFVIMGAAPGQVLGAPQLPAAYWGQISAAETISAGKLEALVADEVCGSIAITAGSFGASGPGKKLMVQGDNLNGKIVSFRAVIDGQVYTCPETAIWRSGDVLELNLSVNGYKTNGNNATDTGAPPAVQNPENTGNPGNSDTQSGTTGGSGSNGSGGSTGSSQSSVGSGSSAGSGLSGASPAAGTTAGTGKQTNAPTSSAEASGRNFRDVPQGHWAATDIQLLVKKGIIKGISDNSFEPSGLVTRAQFTALMVRALALSVDAQTTLPFQDITANEWYYNEVAAAYKAGLIQGTGGAAFDAGAVITREQMACMLIRALNILGKKPAADPSAMQLKFADESSISSWARQECNQAIDLAFIKGYEDGRLLPLGTATRAEAVTMLKRFMVFGQLLNQTE